MPKWDDLNSFTLIINSHLLQALDERRHLRNPGLFEGEGEMFGVAEHSWAAELFLEGLCW